MVRLSTSAPFPATVTRIAPRPEMPGVRRADSRVRGLDRPRGPAAETSGTSAGAIAKRRISPHRPRVWSASGREPMRNPAKRHVTMRTHYRWHMWRIDPKGSYGLIGRTVSQPEVRTFESLAALPLFCAWWQDATLRRRCFHWLGFKDLGSHPAPATKNTLGVPTCAEDSLDLEVVKARIDRFRCDPQAGLR
jgi:hypothetical protein